jgi:hypothetical protein
MDRWDSNKIQNGYKLQYTSEDFHIDRSKWDDYNYVIEEVKKDGFSLKNASNKLKNNYNIVMEAVKNKGYSLIHASKDLKNNYNIVMEAVKNNGYSLECASKDLKNNIYLIYQSIASLIYKSIASSKYQLITNSKYDPIIPDNILKKYKTIEKIYSVFKIYTTKETINIYNNDFDLFIIYK